MAPSDSAYDPTFHLCYGDVKLDEIRNPSYIEVTIKASKTDPFWKGVAVYLVSTLPWGIDFKLYGQPRLLTWAILRGQ